MKKHLFCFAATVIAFNLIQGSIVLADAPPDWSNPSIRQGYLQSCTEKIEKEGEIAFRSGNYADCVKQCNEAIKRSSSDGDAFYFRYCAYEKLGNKAQAQADKAKSACLGYHGQLFFQKGSP